MKMDTTNKLSLNRIMMRNEELTIRVQKSTGEELKTAISELSELTGISEVFITTHIATIKNMTYARL